MFVRFYGDGCDRNECANFWPLEKLQGRTKDPFCPHDSVDSERFALKSVRHCIYRDTGTVLVIHAMPDVSSAW